MQTVYRMVVAKRGARMRAVETPGTQRGIYGGERGPGRIQGFAATTAMLARELAGITGQIVTDNTNLTGMFDWTLQWATETDDATAGPPIFHCTGGTTGIEAGACESASRRDCLRSRQPADCQLKLNVARQHPTGGTRSVGGYELQMVWRERINDYGVVAIGEL
jgi:uncharacterized protein (TIGR03435 family)